LNKEDGYLYKFRKDENVKLNFSFAGFLIQENYISIEKEKILSYDFSSTSLQWKFAIKKLGPYADNYGKEKTYEVNKFIGRFYNTLLFVIESNFILILDFKTGNFVKLVNICKALQLNEATFGNMRPYDIYLDKDKGLVLWLSFHYYIKIEATTLEPKLIKNYALGEKEQWWNIKHSTPYDNFIVFNADYGDKRISPDYLGVADIKTGEILWSEKIIKKGFLVDNPQASQNKLYQRDNNNNLYIYEKE
ncbi:MAG: hypothetical protein P1P88_22155, partial [Bacteroidales bacterium]|nr:hypothetical protein [Bacteroidales bacterium]